MDPRILVERKLMALGQIEQALAGMGVQPALPQPVPTGTDAALGELQRLERIAQALQGSWPEGKHK